MVSKMFSKRTSVPILGEVHKKNAQIESVKERTIQKLIEQQPKKRKSKLGHQNSKKGLLMQQVKKNMAKCNGNPMAGMVSIKKETPTQAPERRKSYPPMVSDVKIKVEATPTSVANSTSAKSLSRRHSADSASAAQRKVKYIDTTDLQHYPKGENPRKSSWQLRKEDNKPGFEGRYRHRHEWQSERQKDLEAYRDGTYNPNRGYYDYDADRW